MIEDQHYTRLIFPRVLWGIIVFVIALTGCQHPEEPADVVVGAGFPTTVTVETQSGEPVAGATVEWAFLRQGVISSFARMASAGVGVFSDVIPFPVTDSTTRVVFRTRPPAGVPEFVGAQRDGDFRLDTTAICGETRLTFDLVRRQVITNCGGALTCSDVNLLCEIPTRLSDTACTDVVTNNTGVPLNIVVTPGAGLPAQVSVRIRIDNGAPVALPASVPNGSSFQVCFYYTVSVSEQSSLVNTSVNITGFAGGACISCDFNLRAEVSVGLVCDCPTAFDSVQFPAPPAEDTVCVGASKDVVIPLSAVRNDNRDGLCDYLFELEKGSGDLDVLAIDINGDPPAGTRLTPGTALGGLRIRFRPTQSGAYADTFVYKVRLQNRGTNGVRDCDDKLVVIFRGRGSEGACVIDIANSTLFRKPGNTIDTIPQCVGLDLNTRTLRILNPSGCVLTLDAPTSSNPLFTVTPPQIVVQPNSAGVFTIHFIPAPSSVWPSGRGNGPATLNFRTVLTMLGCLQGQIAVPGITDTACRGTRSQALHAWGEPQGNWFEGIAMDETTNAINYDNNRSLLGKRDIFVSSIDLANGQAVLGSDRALWKVVQSNRLPANPSETACDISNAFIPQCGTPGAPGTVAVKLWDVVMFDIGGFCGIAWVIGIEPDRPVNGVPSVKLQICYPI